MLDATPTGGREQRRAKASGLMQIYLLDNDHDDPQSCSATLQASGHHVRRFAHPPTLLNAISEHPPSLVLLQSRTTPETGHTVVKRIRVAHGFGLPLLMLSFDCDPASAVAALRAGVDDHLVIPVSAAVLLARIDALQRRACQTWASQPDIHCGPYRLSRGGRGLSLNGQAIPLTLKEFELAWTLFSNADRPVPTTCLAVAVWGKEAGNGSHTVSQHIHTLRRKLRLQDHGYKLASVYGIGYRLETPRAMVPTG